MDTNFSDGTALLRTLVPPAIKRERPCAHERCQHVWVTSTPTWNALCRTSWSRCSGMRWTSTLKLDFAPCDSMCSAPTKLPSCHIFGSGNDVTAFICWGMHQVLLLSACLFLYFFYFPFHLFSWPHNFHLYVFFPPIFVCHFVSISFSSIYLYPSWFSLLCYLCSFPFFLAHIIISFKSEKCYEIRWQTSLS